VKYKSNNLTTHLLFNESEHLFSLKRKKEKGRLKELKVRVREKMFCLGKIKPI